MKLWVDDMRQPPEFDSEPWVWAQTSADALEILQACRPVVLALDHDLGQWTGTDDTTRPIALYLAESIPAFWPVVITVHTANPVGREWLLGTLRRYAPVGVQIS